METYLHIISTEKNSNLTIEVLSMDNYSISSLFNYGVLKTLTFSSVSNRLFPASTIGFSLIVRDISKFSIVF